jgi:hypothetical protein
MEVEISVPNYYRREREGEIKKQKTAMDNILKLGFYEEEAVEEIMTEEEAIHLMIMVEGKHYTMKTHWRVELQLHHY